MGTLHGSCPGTIVCGSAKRLECVCFSTALAWYMAMRREPPRKAAVNRRTPHAPRPRCRPEHGRMPNKRRPNDLDNHDGAAPRISARDLIRLTRMRGCGTSEPKPPSPSGRGGTGPSASFLGRPSISGDTLPPSGLASGSVALPPKSEVIFAQTLTRIFHTPSVPRAVGPRRMIAMRVRKAKPRPSGGRQPGNRVSLDPRDFETPRTSFFHVRARFCHSPDMRPREAL